MLTSLAQPGGGNLGSFDAILNCLRKSTTFSGRAGRREFWCFLRFVLAVWATILLLGALEPRLLQGLLPLGVILLAPLLAVGARRLHDTGISAFALLLLLVPVIGQARLGYVLCRRGDFGTNRFGDDPRCYLLVFAG